MNTSNTAAFTFLAWASFILAFCAEYIGIYNLQESLSVKGYYAVSGAFLIMSSFVLQKTIRDNHEAKTQEEVELKETTKQEE
ncbi:MULTISPECIES: YiaA/YiaB family inner membrane protein [Bacillus]|uniref:YiaA/YiaB family inner membrane protein n=1 Tax=Bacillus TaxID=1386 RepID=UPI00031348A4|nr:MULTISPECIES: YiaA/YiaB family inner membrane protein [Bacillus]